MNLVELARASSLKRPGGYFAFEKAIKCLSFEQIIELTALNFVYADHMSWNEAIAEAEKEVRWLENDEERLGNHVGYLSNKSARIATFMNEGSPVNILIEQFLAQAEANNENYNVPVVQEIAE